MQYLHGRAVEAKTAAMQADFETARETGAMVLRCLASIGMGLRTFDDLAIDLDAAQETPKPYEKPFWNDGFGGALQASIIETLETLTRDFPVDQDMVEAACDILRAGYTESNPGPFTFPPRVTVDFVQTAQFGKSGVEGKSVDKVYI